MFVIPALTKGTVSCYSFRYLCILVDLIVNLETVGIYVSYIARVGEKRNVYSILVGKSEGKRPLGRRRRKWVDNIKMDLREIGMDGVDWIDMAQDRDH
jgi:hypothetical protein